MKRLSVFILLLLTFVSFTNAQIKREQKIENDGFVWYKLSSDTSNTIGVEDSNGKTIIPLTKGFNHVAYSSYGAFYVQIYNDRGLYSKSGVEIIPVGKYKNLILHDGFIAIYNNSNQEGACDLSGKEIISPQRGYESILFMDNWNAFFVKKDGRAGVCDHSGKEIIPPEYEDISFKQSWNGYSVKKEGKEGFYDFAGKAIISTQRGYEDIQFFDFWNGYRVKKEGKEGLCDVSGIETIPPIYKMILYYDDDDTFHVEDENGRWYVYSSSGMEVSPPAPTAESPLFSGQYTYTGMIRTSDDFIGTGEPGLCNIEVFEGRLYFNNDAASYYIGDKTVYGETGRAYGESNKFYLVTNSGDIRYVINVPVSIPMLGTFTDVRVGYFDKGNTVDKYNGKKFSSKNNMYNMNVNAGGYYGGGSYNSGNDNGGYNNSSSQGQRSCSVCYGTGNCQTCSGRGWVNNPYSTDTLPCSTCNPNGNSPTRGKCFHCHGTGRL